MLARAEERNCAAEPAAKVKVHCGNARSKDRMTKLGGKAVAEVIPYFPYQELGQV